MPLIPMPQIGGLDIGGNLLSQTSKRARDNLNLSQDVDGTVITRYPSKILEQNGQPLSDYVGGGFTVKAVMPYVGDKDQADPIVMILDESLVKARQWELALWDLSDIINEPVYMQTSNPAIIDPATLHEYLPSDFIEMEKLLAFRPQIEGPPLENIFGVCQYDGLKWHRAGLPQPYYFTNAITNLTYVRILYGSVNFQGGETYGQYTQTTLNRTGSPQKVNIKPAKVDGVPPYSFLFPAGEASGADRNSLDLGFDDKYLQVTAVGIGSVTYDSINETMTIATTSNNLSVGDWLQFTIPGNFGVTQQPYLFGLRVIASGANVMFDVNPTRSYIYVDKSYWVKASEWVYASSWTSYFPLFLTYKDISNTWVFIFTSPNPSDSYYLADSRPVAFLGATYNYDVDYATDTLGGNASQLVQPFRIPEGNFVRMEDVVDDTSIKIPFPDTTTLLSTFDNLALAADEDVLYWSDTSLGGSTLMTTGLDNMVPGSSKDGPIVGMSAADEFVFIGRKYRNYSIVGTLPTFNFQVNPYAMAQPGPSHFSNVITVGGSVYFGNTLGMWECFGTNMRSLSQAIAGAFYRESDPHYVAGTSVPLRFSALEGSYDSLKGRCIWKVSNPADPAQLDWAIMLDTKTGEWFRWTIMGTNTLQVVNGLWYTANNQNGVSVEDPTRSAGFVPSYYVTAWQTIDAPSLEKQYTQVKVFGRSENDKNLVITTYRDWSETPIPNEDLVIDPLYDLSQKKKVNSNKSLSYSVKVAATTDNQVIQIQGIEIEFNQIQEGMKR